MQNRSAPQYEGEVPASSPVPAAKSGGRHWALFLIVFVYAMHSFDRGIITVVLEPVKDEFSLDDRQMGILGGLSYGLAYGLAAIPIGLLVDRVNRTRLLAALLAVWSLMTLVGGFARSFAALVACRAMVGGAEAGGGPASVSLLSDLYGREERAGVFGLLYLGSGLGGAAAALLGGWVAQQYGWRTALFVAGVPGLLLAASFLALIREPARGGTEKMVTDARASLGETLRFFLRQSSLMWLFLGVPAGGISMSVLGTWTIPFLMRSHGLSLQSAGLVLGLMIGMSVGIAAAVSGYLADWMARDSQVRRLWFAGGCLLASVPTAFVAYSTGDTRIAVAMIFVTQALQASYLAPVLGLVMNLVRPRMRGAAASTRDILGTFVGFGLGPYLAGVISAALGGGESVRYAIIITVLGGALVASFAFAMAGRTIDRDLARAS